jgi:hypothetical protein
MAAMTEYSGSGWTAVLRRRPARLVSGRRVGGYTDVFEIVCCACGDNAGLDYREVSPELRRIRGPYQLAGGMAAYEEHVEGHERGPGPVAWRWRLAPSARPGARLD